MIKDFIKKYWSILVIAFLVGFGTFLFIDNARLQKEAEESEQVLQDAQEQLIISNDQLKQIDMRNEAIHYMEQEEANE